MKCACLWSTVLLLAACSPGSNAPEPEQDAGDSVPPDDAACSPGEVRCDGDFVRLCRDDGSGWQTQYCDPLQGLACNLASGRCQGSCARQYLGQSYMGCDYYPTIAGNDVKNQFEFAVAVSNTTSSPATVTIDWGGLDASIQFQVLPGAVMTQKLPWVEDLKGCSGESAILCANGHWPRPNVVPKGSYRLRSTQPVTVYQFSPLDYHLTDHGDEIFSYTNDASLLFPVNAMGIDYYVAAWGVMPAAGGGIGAPSELAITATEDDTHVTISYVGGVV
jgi:hypothetical protein